VTVKDKQGEVLEMENRLGKCSKRKSVSLMWLISSQSESYFSQFTQWSLGQWLFYIGVSHSDFNAMHAHNSGTSHWIMPLLTSRAPQQCKCANFWIWVNSKIWFPLIPRPLLPKISRKLIHNFSVILPSNRLTEIRTPCYCTENCAMPLWILICMVSNSTMPSYVQHGFLVGLYCLQTAANHLPKSDKY